MTRSRHNCVTSCARGYTVCTSLVAQTVKNLPAVQETWVHSLDWEDPLEKGNTGEYCRLRTPVFWPGEFHGLYSPWGCKESDTTECLSLSGHLIITRAGALYVALAHKRYPCGGTQKRVQRRGLS